MRKFLSTAVVMLIVACLLSLAGCSVLPSLENDINVVYKIDGEFAGSKVVNQFNNAILPEPEKQGYKFLGWSVKEDWTEGDGEELLTANKGLVRYDEVKNFVTEENKTVLLHAIFAVIPPKDLVVAWYAKSSTSGLNETLMTEFGNKLDAYLATQNYTPSEMEIDIRPYEGDVGTSCAAIKKDGDVDIMVGWAGTSNLTGTGGLKEGEDFIYNVGGIIINPDFVKNGEVVQRYAALVTNTELSRLVYVWIQSEYGKGGAELPPLTPVEPEEPEQPEEPEKPDFPSASEITSRTLVVGWYDIVGTSGLNSTIVDGVNSGLSEFLKNHGLNTEELTLTFRAYDGNVETSGGNIIKDGDVDLLLGWAANITSKGGVQYIERVEGVAMGEKTGRLIHRLTENDLGKLVYMWLQTDEALTLLKG